MGGLGLAWGSLGRSWGGLRAVLGDLGLPWGGLGRSWGGLGAVLGDVAGQQKCFKKPCFSLGKTSFPPQMQGNLVPFWWY